MLISRGGSRILKGGFFFAMEIFLTDHAHFKPLPLITAVWKTVMKYYDDKQIQWLRASCTSDVNYSYNTSFYSPKYWYQKTSQGACYSCTYTQARNLQLVESCKLSSTDDPSLAAGSAYATMHAARKLLPSQQHNVSKKLFAMATVDL